MKHFIVPFFLIFCPATCIDSANYAEPASYSFASINQEHLSARRKNIVGAYSGALIGLVGHNIKSYNLDDPYHITSTILLLTGLGLASYHTYKDWRNYNHYLEKKANIEVKSKTIYPKNV